VAIFPLGTATPSVSPYVVACEKVLREATDVKYELTPMGTIIEGSMDRVMQVIRDMHEAPFMNEEIKRVYTIIHIDDRRDKVHTMEGKVKSVLQKLGDAPPPT